MLTDCCLVRVVADEDDCVLFHHLYELLQLAELGLHLGLTLSLVQRVGQEGEALVGLVHDSPVGSQSLNIFM